MAADPTDKSIAWKKFKDQPSYAIKEKSYSMVVKHIYTGAKLSKFKSYFYRLTSYLTYLKVLHLVGFYPAPVVPHPPGGLD